MRKYNIILLISFVFTLTAYSQSTDTDAVVKNEVKKLSFIVGNWEGEGWMMGRDGEKSLFTQTEKIKFKLDSTAMLIEGLGMKQGIVVHNAMAIITYNKAEGHYSFNSYLSTGRGGSFKGELIGEKFYWYPNENMRYIIYLNEKGQWYETGEYKSQENWSQFFEMTLNKK